MKPSSTPQLRAVLSDLLQELGDAAAPEIRTWCRESRERMRTTLEFFPDVLLPWADDYWCRLDRPWSNGAYAGRSRRYEETYDDCLWAVFPPGSSSGVPIASGCEEGMTLEDLRLRVEDTARGHGWILLEDLFPRDTY